MKLKAMASAWTGLCLGFQQTSSFVLIPKNSVSENRNDAFVVSSGHKNRSTEEDNSKKSNYWFHEDIHTLGNTGILGGLHAALAPLSTKMIDLLAFKGMNVREKIAVQILEQLLSSQHAESQKFDEINILDLGCGVGMSTTAISSAARQVERGNFIVTGVDTSPEMIAMARTKDLEHEGITKLSENHKCTKSNHLDVPARIQTKFIQANAENTPFSSKSFDLVTIMYVLHEAPFRGRENILHEAQRVLKPGGILAIVDISNDYVPSSSMLSGEPYLEEYQKNFSTQLSCLKGVEVVSEAVAIPGHVVLYTALKKFDPWWKKYLPAASVMRKQD